MANSMADLQCIVLEGGVIDGFKCIGPFADMKAAIAYTERKYDLGYARRYVTIAFLEPPTKQKGGPSSMDTHFDNLSAARKG